MCWNMRLAQIVDKRRSSHTVELGHISVQEYLTMKAREVFAKAIGRMFASNRQIRVISQSMLHIMQSVPQRILSHEGGEQQICWIWRYYKSSVIYKKGKYESKSEESMFVSWPSKQEGCRNSQMWWYAGGGRATLTVCTSCANILSDEKRNLSLTESMCLMRLLRLCRKEVQKVQPNCDRKKIEQSP